VVLVAVRVCLSRDTFSPADRGVSRVVSVESRVVWLGVEWRNVLDIVTIVVMVGTVIIVSHES
jgi:hypothetical protein